MNSEQGPIFKVMKPFDFYETVLVKMVDPTIQYSVCLKASTTVAKQSVYLCTLRLVVLVKT